MAPLTILRALWHPDLIWQQVTWGSPIGFSLPRHPRLLARLLALLNSLGASTLVSAEADPRQTVLCDVLRLRRSCCLSSRARRPRWGGYRHRAFELLGGVQSDGQVHH